MKVVVTGASGFFGKRVVAELLKRGIQTCAASRCFIKSKNYVFLNSYYDTPSGDVLIHLAENSNRAEVNQLGHKYIDELEDMNKFLISNNYSRIIYASSVAVYGDKSKEKHNPNGPVLITDTYSKSKLNCEKLFREENAVIARISNVYGNGMSAENIFNKIFSQLNCENINIWNDKPIRDFIWIDDAVTALVDMALGEKIGTYNVASGEEVSIKKLVCMILRASNIIKKPNLLVSKPTDEYSAIMLDITNTFNSFGWLPKTTLECGIAKLFNKNKVKNKVKNK